MSTLPVHQRREILLRLPVKSLIRFKVVEKAWKTLIEDKIFVIDYFNHHAEDGVLVHKYQI